MNRRWRSSPKKLGRDPVEFRLQNLAESGESIHPGMRPIDADVPGDVREAARLLHAGRPLARGHGRSVCCSCSDAGAHPVTLAMVQVYADGAVSVLEREHGDRPGQPHGSDANRRGRNGRAAEKVRLIGSDTAVTLFERSTGASRTTTLMGRAVLEACREAIAQCKTMAADVLGVPMDLLIEKRGGVRSADARLTWFEILERYFQMEGCSIIGRAYLRKAGDLDLIPVFWEIGVVGAEIAARSRNRKNLLDTLVTIGDVGLAINPAMTEGQDLAPPPWGWALDYSRS